MKRRPDGEGPPRPARRNRRGLTPEERTLWAHVVQNAKPMPGRTLPVPEPEEKPVPAVPLLPPAKAPLRPRLLPLAGVERRLLKDLSRGSRQVDGRLDLHGMRQAEAHQALRAFLHRHHALGSKLLLVITGKGGGPDSLAGERGILRRLVPHWLADPDLRPLVIGFDVSARQHGGEGALYVRLRRRRDT